MKIILILALLTCGPASRPRAQSYELQRLILDIEKLSELKNVLNDLYKGYQILSTGYQTIKGISEGSFTLHQAFLDGLWLVSPAVRDDQRVAAIIQYQATILSEYRRAMGRFRSNGHFRPDELLYLAGTYDHLIDASAANTEALLDVLTARKLRMSDAQRLERITRLYESSRNQFLFLRQFTNSTELLGQHRKFERGEIQTLGQYYDHP